MVSKKSTLSLAAIFLLFNCSNASGPLDPSKPVNVTVRCPTNDDQAQIRWYLPNGTEITKHPKFEIDDKNKTLTIIKMDETDHIQYTCIDDFIKLNATVYAIVRPHVKGFGRASKTIAQGDTFEATCLAWGNPCPQLSWFHGGKRIEENERITIVARNESKWSNASLSIKLIQATDSGVFTCVAENGVDSRNTTITLRIASRLAALWPFLGIVIEVAILCVIIIFYEKRKAKQLAEEAKKEAETQLLTNPTQTKSDVRQRK